MPGAGRLRWRDALLAAALALLVASPVHAVQPDEILKDAALEQRARALSRELRCMVCQNQSIDDSDAPLARDLRLLVRERVTAGDSDKQVIDYLTERYGAFVLLKPQWGASTLLLWITPALVFGLGLAGLGLWFRRRRSLVAADAHSGALSAEEEARLAALRSDIADRPIRSTQAVDK